MHHQPVLLQAAVDALLTRRDGCYVDGTFGRGGHSQEILRRLNAQGRLLAIDKDPAAIAVGRQLQQQDTRFSIKQGSFADITCFVGEWQPTQQIDGLLLDLGVSSPQVDQAERGFSFLRDGPLDMRMDPGHGLSAAQWLATANGDVLTDVLKRYGEERYARRIANAIVNARRHQAIDSTLQLADIVAKAHPAWQRGRHPATKTFQAIRIFINNELADLSGLLEQLLALLTIGGRLVVISFHSLEDRLVKRFIKQYKYGDNLPRRLPVTVDQIDQPQLKAIGSAYRADAAEIAANPRASSAIMRVAEKIV